MPEFVVKLARLSTILFTVDAKDEADARARYRQDGEETDHQINKQVIIKVTPRGEEG
jgi:hypothetical protein